PTLRCWNEAGGLRRRGDRRRRRATRFRDRQTITKGAEDEQARPVTSRNRNHRSRRMKRRTRHTLILLGVPILLLLALGGWIVDAIRKPWHRAVARRHPHIRCPPRRDRPGTRAGQSSPAGSQDLTFAERGIDLP